MDEAQPLHGSCSCGRYNYIVVLPQNDTTKAQVHFNTDSEHRRNQAALLTAFLRVPLTWYQSRTVSFFPDETHNSISRTFSPLHEPHCKRKFCGYCGTHLSYWTEQPDDEQDYVHITLGSLRSKDLEILEDLGLLPGDTSAGDLGSSTSHQASGTVSAIQNDDTVRSAVHEREGPMTWFEEMIDGSQLGQTRKTRRGVGTSADGSTTVQWEVTEYNDGMSGTTTPITTATGSKRKLEDAVTGS